MRLRISILLVYTKDMKRNKNNVLSCYTTIPYHLLVCRSTLTPAHRPGKSNNGNLNELSGKLRRGGSFLFDEVESDLQFSDLPT